MIKYLKNSEIDRSKWDHCVVHSINASYSALSGVLDIAASNWDGLVYDDYVAVFPLPWRKKFGFKYIYPPFFTAQLGLFAMEELEISMFLQAIPKGFRFAEIILQQDQKSPDFVQVFKHNRTFHLDLVKSYEELSAGFSKNHRQNIRKAFQTPLSITKEAHIQPIIDLFQQNKGDVSSFKSVDYQMLHQLVTYLFSIGMMEVWNVYDETNTLCAGGFFIKDFRKIIFMFSGSDEVAKKRRAMFFLFDQFIKEHAGSKNILDFCGSNDDNLARFYEGFGSTRSYYDTIRMGQLLRILNPSGRVR